VNEYAGRHDDELRSRTARLLASLRSTRNPEEQRRLRHLVVTTNLPVAKGIALRYRGRGIDVDELIQAAYLGLVKAVRRFDCERGDDFLPYAVPTITGELKRHFRDQGWDIRPPRRIQQLRSEIERAVGELTQAVGQPPRPSEIAAHLKADQEDVIECLAAGDAYHVRSLDTPIGHDDDVTVAETLGAPDPGHAKIEDLMTLRGLLQELPARDRRILALRFFHGWTQRQIAADIGVTQMQVSRRLSQVLARLREGMTGESGERTGRGTVARRGAEVPGSAPRTPAAGSAPRTLTRSAPRTTTQRAGTSRGSRQQPARQHPSTGYPAGCPMTQRSIAAASAPVPAAAPAAGPASHGPDGDPGHHGRNHRATRHRPARSLGIG